MLFPVLIYITLSVNALFSFLFHINWVKKSIKLPLALISCYLFSLVWYITGTLVRFERNKIISQFNINDLNLASGVFLVASILCALYNFLTIKAVLLPNLVETKSQQLEVDKKKPFKYVFAIPLHLIGYLLLVATTSITFVLIDWFIGQ
jgi:hypothetical protein